MPIFAPLLATVLAAAPPPGLRFPDADPAEKAPAAALSEADAKRQKAKQHMVAGAYHQRHQRFSQALREYRSALRLQPELLPALKDAAKLAHDLDSHDEALRYAERALATDGTDAEMLTLAARVLFAKGRLDDALPKLETANKLVLLAQQDVGLYVEVRELLAEIHGRKNNHLAAAAALRELLEVVENPAKFGLDAAGGRQLAGTRPGLALRLVAALRRAGDGPAALAAIADLVKKDDRLGPLLREQRAEVELENGNAAAALAILKEGFDQIAPTSAESLALLRRVCEKAGGLKEYDAKLERLAKTYPGNQLVRTELAQRRFEAGDLDGAKALFGEGRPSLDGLALLVRIAAKAGKADDTLAALRPLLNAVREEQRRDNPQELALDLDKLSGELSAKRKLVEQMADRIVAGPNPADEEAQAVFLFVEDLAFDAGAQTQGLALAERAYKLRVGNFKYHLERTFLALLALKRPQAALDFANQLGRQEAADPIVTRYRGLALAKLGKFAEGEKLLKDGQLRPGGEDLVWALVELYRQDLRYDAALATLRKLIDGPDRAASLRARYTAASIHSFRKRDDLAEVELLKVLEAEPEARNDPRIDRYVVSAKNDLGYIWADAGKHLDRAERMIREAVAKEPANAAYLDSLGWALFKRGRTEEAVKYLKQAAEMSGGDDPTLWDHCGDALLKAGRKAEAIAAFRKSAELYADPDHEREKDKAEPVRRKLEALDGGSAEAPAAKN